MAKEDAARFLQDVQVKRELQEKIVPAFDMEEGRWDEKQLVSIAGENGYQFDYQDIEAASKELRIPDELPEEALDTIAGGGCSSSSCITCCCSCCCSCT